MSKHLIRTFAVSATLILVSLLSIIEIPNAEAYGNETIQVNIDGGSTYFEYGEDTSFTIILGDLDTSVNYDLEWRLCEYQGNLDGDWVDGDCYTIQLYQEYEDANDWMMVEETLGGSVTATGSTTASSAVNIPVMWDMGITDVNGDNVETASLQNGADYYIGVMLTINGVSIESGESNPFAYGHSGWTQVNYGTSGNILENMDYSFSIMPRDLFSTNLVQSMVNWEITDDATSLVVDSDSYDPSIGPQQTSSGMYTITVPSSNLPVGDYTLDIWIEVDGNGPPTTVLEQGGHTHQYAEGVLKSHSFSVIDPAFGTMASFSPSQPTITMQTEGWATIVSSVDQLNNGDLHKLEWTIYEQNTPNVVIHSDMVQWVAPPSTNSITTHSNLLTETGTLCFSAELYVGNNGPVDTQTDCWTQTAISPNADTDGDGVADIQDHCPLDSFQNDNDNDGCDDPVDSDSDGLPDWWEALNNLDPNDASGLNGATGDPDNDGLDNIGEYMTTSDPNNPDTDQDTVNDGIDQCVMTPGLGPDGCPIGNSPPTCDIFYSLEADGMTAQGSAAIPSILPGSASETIELPEGEYYIIAVCEDPDGDMVSISFNNQPVVSGVSTVTAGILVEVDEDSSSSQTVTIDWGDGTVNLQTSITLEIEEEDSSSSSSSIPGFGLIITTIGMISAAILLRKEES